MSSKTWFRTLHRHTSSKHSFATRSPAPALQTCLCSRVGSSGRYERSVDSMSRRAGTLHVLAPFPMMSWSSAMSWKKRASQCPWSLSLIQELKVGSCHYSPGTQYFCSEVWKWLPVALHFRSQCHPALGKLQLRWSLQRGGTAPRGPPLGLGSRLVSCRSVRVEYRSRRRSALEWPWQ